MGVLIVKFGEGGDIKVESQDPWNEHAHSTKMTFALPPRLQLRPPWVEYREQALKE